MALPELIEIVPLAGPAHAEITVPGSKSITNRALVLAALADGETTLRGALWSEDTQVMVDSLQRLGFGVTVAPDPAEFCNRTISVRGMGGEIPRGGEAGKPLELFVGNAGTAARFLSAMVCLGHGPYRLSGTPRMHERPQGALFTALRQLGYEVASANDKLPAIIHGTGPHAGACTVSIEESSQFASALLLCAEVGGWEIEVTGENAEESPYVAMTLKLIEAFPKNGGTFDIEPDASSAAYFWAAHLLGPHKESPYFSEELGTEVEITVPSIVTTVQWPHTGWQVDERFPAMLYRSMPLMPGLVQPNEDLRKIMLDNFLRSPAFSMRREISRRDDLGDSIMMAIILAPFALFPIKFSDLGRLRVQECERVFALRTELTRCGARVEETGDTLEVFPSKLHGAEIETYNDHRMAMCFAILGLKVPGIRIKNPSCVKKTFPNFFQKLAGAPPSGLGAKILDARTGRVLEGTDLFAE
jgi:3-phosphoshikimate 1-carboxyvinyltransferase